MRLLLLAFLICSSLPAQFGPVLGSAGVKAYSGGGGGITEVDFKAYFSTANSLSHAIVLPGGSPAQNNLIAVCATSDGTMTTPIGFTQAASAPDFNDHKFFYKIAGASESATINIPITPTDSLAAHAWVLSGLSATVPFDKQVGNTGQGAAFTINSGTIPTTTAANEVLITCIGSSSADAIPPITGWSNSFVQRATSTTTGSTTNGGLTSATRIVSATGSYSTAATHTSSTTSHASVVSATFK